MTEFCDIKKRHKARKGIYTDGKPAGSDQFFVIKINTSLKNVAVFYDTFILFLSFVTPTLHATKLEDYHIGMQEEGRRLINRLLQNQ